MNRILKYVYTSALVCTRPSMYLAIFFSENTGAFFTSSNTIVFAELEILNLSVF